MAFKETLKQLRKEKGLSQQDLADLFGYKSFTTIQKWEDGSAMPPARILTQLAQTFEVAMETLLEEHSQVKVPILGTVRGGPLRLAQQEWLGQEYVLSSEINHGEYFYLEVMGDSMVDARIYPKDLIYVKRQNQVDHGDIAVVLVGEEATVKRVYFENQNLILHPENTNYHDMVFSLLELEEKNIQILGKVLHVKIRL